MQSHISRQKPTATVLSFYSEQGAVHASTEAFFFGAYYSIAVAFQAVVVVEQGLYTLGTTKSAHFWSSILVFPTNKLKNTSVKLRFSISINRLVALLGSFFSLRQHVVQQILGLDSYNKQ